MTDFDTLILTAPRVEESEIDLYIGNELFQQFLCTPEALEELAVGHLYCRGIIRSRDQLDQLEIITKEDKAETGYNIKVLLKDAIGKEETSPRSFNMPPAIHLQEMAERIKKLAEKYKIHGGVHCAVLSDGHDITALYEDVGRHNAFDKAVGAAVMKGLSPCELIYFSSGRINSEIAEKAAVCGIPLLVSRSIATTRACAIAREFHMGIIGRIESEAPLLYSLPEAF